MKIKDSSEAKVGRADHKVLKLVLVLVLLAVAAASVYAGLKMASIRNSPEFNLSEPSAYLFYSTQPIQQDASERGSTFGELVASYVTYVFGEHQTVEIVAIPAHSFFHSTKVNVSELQPRELLNFINETLGVKISKLYLVPLEKFLQFHGAKTFENLVSQLSRTGLRFFDYFALGGKVTKLRPESNLTEASLAKLYHAMRNFAISPHLLPTMTKKPLRITVAGKVYLRNYVDEDQLQKLRQVILQNARQEHGN